MDKGLVQGPGVSTRRGTELSMRTRSGPAAVVAAAALALTVRSHADSAPESTTPGDAAPAVGQDHPAARPPPLH